MRTINNSTEPPPTKLCCCWQATNPPTLKHSLLHEPHPTELLRICERMAIPSSSQHRIDGIHILLPSLTPRIETIHSATKKPIQHHQIKIPIDTFSTKILNPSAPRRLRTLFFHLARYELAS